MFRSFTTELHGNCCFFFIYIFQQSQGKELLYAVNVCHILGLVITRSCLHVLQSKTSCIYYWKNNYTIVIERYILNEGSKHILPVTFHWTFYYEISDTDINVMKTLEEVRLSFWELRVEDVKDREVLYLGQDNTTSMSVSLHPLRFTAIITLLKWYTPNFAWLEWLYRIIYDSNWQQVWSPHDFLQIFKLPRLDYLKCLAVITTAENKP